jgi:hypothetical protein
MTEKRLRCAAASHFGTWWISRSTQSPTAEGQPGRPREWFLAVSRNFN